MTICHSFRGAMGMLCVRTEEKEESVLNTQIWGSKDTVFAWLLNIEWSDSFRTHLDLALVPKKQMKGLRSNGTSSNTLNRGTLSLNLRCFRPVYQVQKPRGLS